MKAAYGEYLISSDAKKTAQRYASLPPYLLKCSCPSCQNFLKAAKKYANELESCLAPLGIDWRNPDDISVLWAGDDAITYEAVYPVCGKRLRAPKLYKRTKNELGEICVLRREALWNINGVMSLRFEKAGKGETAAVLRARLPWLLSGLTEKPKSRPARVAAAVKRMREIIKK